MEQTLVFYVDQYVEINAVNAVHLLSIMVIGVSV